MSPAAEIEKCSFIYWTVGRGHEVLNVLSFHHSYWLIRPLCYRTAEHFTVPLNVHKVALAQNLRENFEFHPFILAMLTSQSRGLVALEAATSTVKFWGVFSSVDTCGFMFIPTERVCVCGTTWSLRVWFSACTAASSRSLSLSCCCVFS